MNSAWTHFLQASAPSEHGAHVYSDVSELAQSVGAYLAAGFDLGEPAVVIATPEHWSQFAERLAVCGWGEEELEEQGLLRVADADETLAAIMVDGAPSRERFEQVIGGLLDRVEERFPGRRIRAFGEMVDLLCQRGDREERRRARGSLECAGHAAELLAALCLSPRRLRSSDAGVCLARRLSIAFAHPPCRRPRPTPASGGFRSRRGARRRCRQGLRADVRPATGDEVRSRGATRLDVGERRDAGTCRTHSRVSAQEVHARFCRRSLTVHDATEVRATTLFERIVAASGLVPAVAPFTIRRLLIRELILPPESVTREELERVASGPHAGARRVLRRRRARTCDVGSPGAARAGEDDEWPREELNLRAQVRSLPLYPLSYGALWRVWRPVCPTAHSYPLHREVAVAQLVEPRVVVPVVAGSSPVRHPSSHRLVRRSDSPLRT